MKSLDRIIRIIGKPRGMKRPNKTQKTSRIGRMANFLRISVLGPALQGSNFQVSGFQFPVSNLPLQPSSFNLHPSKRASSLITTLLVLVVLSTIVVAFMQSMSIERRVANSESSRYRAELAVSAALNTASKQLLNAITNQQAGGVAYTTWAYYPNPTINTYYSALTTGRPSLLGDTSFLSTNNTSWLFSSAATYGAGSLLEPNPDMIADLPLTNKVNLNSKGLISSDKNSIDVPWHEIERATNGGLIEIVRFAYWVDDESSRWNIATDRLNTETNALSLRKDGTSVDEIAMTNILSVSDALTISQSTLAKITRKSAAQLLSTSSVPEIQANHFLFTTRSISDNRIKYGPTNSGDYRRGMKKINLNWSDLTNTSIAADIRIKALTDAVEEGSPDFLSANAVKYYPASADTNPPSVVAPSFIRQEMRKSIAASIIDNLDGDSFPTQPSTMLIATNTNFPPPPVRLMSDMPRPAYFGIDSGPMINEVSVIWNALEGQTVAQANVQQVINGDGTFTYTIPVVWRFELWNMSNQPLAARNYKIRAFYLQQIRASAFGFGGEAIPEDTERIFDLGSFAFAPGEIKTVEISQSFTTTGPVDRGTTWNTFRLGGTGTGDDEPDGHARCAYALFDAITGTWFHFTPYLDAPEAPSDGNNTAGIGNKGGSKGNRINDPRVQPLRSYALNTSFTGDISPISHDPDRDWSSAGTGSIGRINNAVNGFNYQHLGFWHDKPRTLGNGSDLLSTAVISQIKNAPFGSSGELGNVFDPSWYNPINRGSDTDGANSLPYRQTLRTPFKGGATLRIGQPCGNTNYAANSWILTDVLGTSATAFSSGAYEMEVSKFLPTSIHGQINVNFPKSTITAATTNQNLQEVFRLPALSVTSGAGTNINASLVQAEIKSRLTKSAEITNWQRARPFFMPSEISEMQIWTNYQLYSPTETLQSFPMGYVNNLNRLNRGDYAREEITQRSIGLLTTAGSAFRIYVIGQYCTAPAANPSKVSVRATRILQTTAHVAKEFNESNGMLTNATIRLFDTNYD